MDSLGRNWTKDKHGMKLPATTRNVWLTHRTAIRSIAEDPAKPSRVMLTGGTVLNARWNHRESIDIDILLPDRDDVTELWPEKRLDLQSTTGGEILRKTRFRITAEVPQGILDISAMQPELTGSEQKTDIEGHIETVLTSAQIIRGKLNRIKDALPRDAFDLIAAAKAEPIALEIAVNALSPDQRKTSREHLARSSYKIALEAPEALMNVPSEYETPVQTMGHDAAESLKQHEYTRVQIYKTEDGIRFLTLPRHGTLRPMNFADDARAALRDSGIAEYLDGNCTVSSYEVETALKMLAENSETGLILDTNDDDPRDRTRSILEGSDRGSTQPERVRPKRADRQAVVRGKDRRVGGGTVTTTPSKPDHKKPGHKKYYP